jgi:hypothetical protein
MTAMPRERLAHRRPSVTLGLDWNGHVFAVTAGFAPDGCVREVFASGTRTGSDMQRMIDDACVIISLALQFGALPGDLRRSLGSIPDPAAGMADAPASVIGAILRAIGDLEVPAP